IGMNSRHHKMTKLQLHLTGVSLQDFIDDRIVRGARRALVIAILGQRERRAGNTSIVAGSIIGSGLLKSYSCFGQRLYEAMTEKQGSADAQDNRQDWFDQIRHR